MADGNLDYRRLQSLEAIVQASTDNPESRAYELKQENRELREKLDRSREKHDASTTMGTSGPVEDFSAFFRSGHLWRERFETYDQFRAWMKRHPEVREIKKGNRRRVHAGDVTIAWNKEQSGASSTVAERFIDSIEIRKARVRRKPKG